MILAKIFEHFKHQLSRPHTLPSVIGGLGSLSIGLIMGISDNPPAIFLVYVGLVLMSFSLIHHWRSPSQYGTLFAVAVISFPVLVLLHNIFDTLNVQLGSIPILTELFIGISVISFVGAVLITPAVAVTSMLLGLFYLIKSKL